MKELCSMALLTGLSLLLFITTLTFSILKKSRQLNRAAWVLLFVFAGFASWTGFVFLQKSYNKISETLKPRTGAMIYDALFGPAPSKCVHVLNHQDQLLPKIDFAIWLQVETCPEELTRILSKHPYSTAPLSTANWEGDIPGATGLDWFKPASLGDTILVFEYARDESQQIQTIWANKDRTQAYIRDIR